MRTRPPLIWVAPEVSGGRARWTIFHEVGHHDIPSHEAACFIDEDRGLRPAEGRPALLPTERYDAAYQGVLLGQSEDLTDSFVPVTRETPESLRRKRQEREANDYAAELIMPAPMFFPEARQLPIGTATIDYLSNRYRASFEATAIRYGQACPERALVFAAEPVLRADGAIEAFEVVYSKRAARFLSGLRQGTLLAFAGLLKEAWTARGPVQGLITTDLLGLGHRVTLSADALRLGQYQRIVAIVWLESGQLPLL